MLTPSNGIFPRQKCAKNCLNSGEIEDGIREPTVSEPILCEKKKTFKRVCSLPKTVVHIVL